MPRRSNSRSCTTVSGTVLPSFCFTTVTRWFFLIFPAKTRPMAILPTNSEYCSAMICICSGFESSPSGGGIVFRIASNSGLRFFGSTVMSVVAMPARPEA